MLPHVIHNIDDRRQMAPREVVPDYF